MVLAIIVLGVKVSQTANLSISLVERINIGDLKQSRVKSENVSFPYLTNLWFQSSFFQSPHAILCYSNGWEELFSQLNEKETLLSS